MRRFWKSMLVGIMLAVLFGMPGLIKCSFAETDVTDKVELVKSRMMFDLSTSQNYLDVSIKNISEDVLLTPIKVVIDSISSTDVTVANADGTTEDGKPYFEYNTTNGQLLNGYSTSEKRWSFANPSRARFSYTTAIYASLPEVAAVIGIEGGVIKVDNPASPLNGVTLNIPPGALSSTETISIGYAEDLPPFQTGNDGIGYGLSLQPDGIVFNRPVTIIIPYSDDAVNNNHIVNESGMQLYLFNEELRIWLAQDSSVDPDQNLLTAELTHFCYADVNGDRLYDLNYENGFKSKSAIEENFVDSNLKQVILIHGVQLPVDNLFLRAVTTCFDINNVFASGFGDTEKTFGELSKLLGEEGYQVWGLNYDSWNNIYDKAETLSEAITKISGWASKDINVHVIAHSMGGLVTRTYMVSNEYKNNIGSALFLGTPNHGAYIANLASHIFSGFDSFIQDTCYRSVFGPLSVLLNKWRDINYGNIFTSFAQMIPNSDFLINLNSRTIDTGEDNKLWNVYNEDLPLFVSPLQNGDFVVNWEKAFLDNATVNKSLSGYAHMNLIVPVTDNDAFFWFPISKSIFLLDWIDFDKYPGIACIEEDGENFDKNNHAAWPIIQQFLTENEPSTCGAYIAPGVWKEFDCYNLAAIGKTTNDDPFTPSWRLIGGYWKWGRKGPDESQWYDTNTPNFAHGPTGPNEADANDGEIDGWDTSYADDGAWSDDEKTANDPCPAGYRIPTYSQWQGVIDNNTQRAVGTTWSSSATDYSNAKFFGDDLMLPAAGYRNYSSGSLGYRGRLSYYWSSTEDSTNSSVAWHLFFFRTYDACMLNGYGRSNGFSVRCVAE